MSGGEDVVRGREREGRRLGCKESLRAVRRASHLESLYYKHRSGKKESTVGKGGIRCREEMPTPSDFTSGRDRAMVLERITLPKEAKEETGLKKGKATKKRTSASINESNGAMGAEWRKVRWDPVIS